jgi:hypothetical protein
MLLHIMQIIRLGYTLTARCLTPGWNKRHFLQMSSGVLGLTQPPIQWIPTSVLEAKRPVRDVDNSPPFSTKTKSDWSYCSAMY